MGSGETSPTMVELHKSLTRGRTVTVLDTPYGFQANANELSAKAVDYFARSVSVTAEVVSLRSADVPMVDIGRALAAVRAATYVFAGPGSPSYVQEQWSRVGMVDALEAVVRADGTVVLASAASVSSGALTLPVYEIYKVGKAPFWLPGLDLLGRFGLHAAVVPHFNNSEGGTHDTSCCYVGRARLDLLRAQSPAVPVLGIDEHTALVINPVTGQGTVHGQSSAHVLIGDQQVSVTSGGTLELRALLSGDGGPVVADRAETATAPGLSDAVRARDAAQVLTALLAALPADPSLAASVAALEPVLAQGWSDPTERYVDLLLDVRARARAEKQWALSDLVRDGLGALGLVVEDTPDGQRLVSV